MGLQACPSQTQQYWTTSASLNHNRVVQRDCERAARHETATREVMFILDLGATLMGGAYARRSGRNVSRIFDLMLG